MKEFETESGSMTPPLSPGAERPNPVGNPTGPPPPRPSDLPPLSGYGGRLSGGDGGRIERLSPGGRRRRDLPVLGPLFQVLTVRTYDQSEDGSTTM